MKRRSGPAIGVILAGGRGLRMGGSKLAVVLHGRPLIAYPLSAMRAALSDVAVVAKSDVELPHLEGVMVWIEPDEPRNPLVGIVEALALADGRPVLACPADLPFVTPTLLVQLSQTLPEGASAVVASSNGVAQPLLGCYQPEAAELLAAAAGGSEAGVAAAVAGLQLRLIEVADPTELFDVDSPEDLLIAAAMMDQPKVKS
jgi:molybdopterin-guanine dinucleotide biosynthesis protein A